MIPTLWVLCWHDLARKNTKPTEDILEIWSLFNLDYLLVSSENKWGKNIKHMIMQIFTQCTYARMKVRKILNLLFDTFH